MQLFHLFLMIIIRNKWTVMILIHLTECMTCMANSTCMVTMVGMFSIPIG